MIFPEVVVIITVLAGVAWSSAVAALYVGLGRIGKPTRNDKPHVSVLIAVRNEESHIGKCLEALRKQDYPVDLREIIVIDDNSTDRTKTIAESYIDRILGLIVLPAGDPFKGIAPKKNAIINGIKHSTGEIILFTDADCEPRPAWISGIVRNFSNDVDAVAGYSPLYGSGLIGRICGFDGFVNGVISAGSIGLKRPVTVTGRNFAYRRTAWDRVGGFGSTAQGASGDDDLLLQRIASGGGVIAFATDVRTHVPAEGPESLADWLRMKRRHLSAGKRYHPALILLSALMYLFQIGLITVITLAALQLISWFWVLGIWGVKLIVDGMTLRRGARVLNEKNWSITFLIATILTPLIFTCLIPMSVFGRIRWKGRRLKG